MNDIYDIKNVVNLYPFHPYTIFIILAGVFLLIVFLLYLKYKKSYENLIKKEQLRQNNLINLKEIYLKKLKKLNFQDKNFFVDINYIVREYLEKSGIIDKPTRKTALEIKNYSKQIKDLNNFIDVCNKFEFSKEESKGENKIDILEKAISIIKN